MGAGFKKSKSKAFATRANNDNYQNSHSVCGEFLHTRMIEYGKKRKKKFFKQVPFL